MKAVRIATDGVSLLSFLRGQADFWRERGMDWIYAGSPGRGLREAGSRDCVRTIPIPMERRMAPLSDLRATASLVRALRRERPILVHTHTPKAGLLGQLAAFAVRVPCRVHTMHGLPYLAKPGLFGTVLRGADAVTSRLASSVTVVAPWMARQLAADRICPPSKIGLVSLSSRGIDVEEVCSTPASVAEGAARRDMWSIPADAPLVGYIGRLVCDKGLPELAEAWREVRRQVKGVHLVLIGPWEEEDQVPPDIREELEADASVCIPGPSFDVVPWLSTFDLLVLPTHREGLPMVLLEAQATGTPVVTTDISACRSAMRDGETGIAVPAGDARRLAGAITGLLLRPARRRRYGAAGRRLVVDRFQAADRRREMAAFYARLLREKGFADEAARIETASSAVATETSLSLPASSAGGPR